MTDEEFLLNELARQDEAAFAEFAGVGSALRAAWKARFLEYGAVAINVTEAKLTAAGATAEQLAEARAYLSERLAIAAEQTADLAVAKNGSMH